MGRKSLNLLAAAVTAMALLAGCGSSKGMMQEASTEAPAMMAETAYDDAYLYDAGYGAADTASAEMPEEALAEEMGFETGKPRRRRRR